MNIKNKSDVDHFVDGLAYMIGPLMWDYANDLFKDAKPEEINRMLSDMSATSRLWFRYGMRKEK